MASGSLILDAQVDRAALEDLAKRLGDVRDGVPKVLSRAVNRVMPGLRKDMVEAVRHLAPIKATVIRKAGGYTRATVKQPWAKTWLAGYPIALSYFPFTPRTNFPYTKRGRSRRPAMGVSVFLGQARGARVLPGSFVVARAKAWPGSSGNRFEVVERVHRTRFPIRILHGPTPGEILAGDQQAVEGLVKRARQRFLDRANHETQFLFRQTGLYGVTPKES